MTAITVPSEFREAIADEARIDLVGRSGDLGIVQSRGDDEFDEAIAALRRAVRAYDAATSRASDAIDVDVLGPLVRYAVGSLHYEIDEHDHNDLDELTRLVDRLKQMYAWAEANGIAIPSEATA